MYTWFYQTDDEEEEKIEKYNKKPTEEKIHHLSHIEKDKYSKCNKIILSIHTIKEILEKIPEAIRPTIDDYLKIYYIVEDKNIILNSKFIIDKINY